MERSKTRLSTMDRIAIAAIIVVAVVIVALVEITARAQMRIMPSAAVVALATHVELPGVNMPLRKSAATTRSGRI
jgi:hypothetical protein